MTYQQDVNKKLGDFVDIRKLMC